MRFKPLALAALLCPLALTAVYAGEIETGGVPLTRTVTVVPTNVVAGIGNEGHLTVKNVGNVKPGVNVRFGDGKSAPLVETITVAPTNVVAGIDNVGTLNVQNVGNREAATFARRGTSVGASPNSRAMIALTPPTTGFSSVPSVR